MRIPFFNRKQTPQTPNSPRVAYVRKGKTLVHGEQAMYVAAYFSGVIYISTQIAKLPWKVKDKDNNVLVDNRVHRLLNLLPNPEMNAFTFRLLLTQSALNKGNGYAEIERDMLGRPVALWPIRSDAVQVIRTPDGELLYEIMDGAAKGQNAYLRPKDMYHIKNFYTKDGLTGESIIHWASEALGIASGADQFANALFANGGMPSGILKTPGALSDEAYERLRKSWQQAHSGRQVGGTAILEEGTSYDTVGLDPEVLQFLETRKFSVLEIARYLRLPPTKLYDQQTSSYNNIEHANLEVAVDTLDAWARNYEMEADVKLLGESYGGRHSEIDIYSVFRGDMDTRSQYFSRMMQNAALSPNEIRIKEGESPYEGGDRYYIASNNYTPVDKLDALVDAQINKNDVKEAEDKKDEPTEEEEQMDSSLKKAALDYLTHKN